MSVQNLSNYYQQFLDCKIIDYKIVDNFPVLILRKEVNGEEFLYEILVSKNDQGTEPGVLLGFPAYNSLLE